jgi:hypothetical protein
VDAALATINDAHRRYPRRAELLVEAAALARAAGRHAEAYEFAARAAGKGGWATRFAAEDELALAAFHLGRPQETVMRCERLLDHRMLDAGERLRIEANRDCALPIAGHALLAHDDGLIRKLTRAGRRRRPQRVTLTITSCRRLAGFIVTVRSFLNACADLELVDRFLCVDDGSSAEDRARMQALFPFFEFVWKSAEQKGHARSMNLIRTQVASPWWLHLEDDWQFLARRVYVRPAIELMQENPRLGQVLFNRNYGETLADRDLVGGQREWSRRHRYRHVRHEHFAEGSQDWRRLMATGRNCAYWPHWSLRPSLAHAGRTLHELGAFDEQAPHFELERARRYAAAGFESAFLDGIHALHIGRLTSQRGPNAPANAYALNDEQQFGEAPQPAAASIRIEVREPLPRLTFTVTTSRRMHLFFRSMDSFLRHCTDHFRIQRWLCADDGSDPADLAAMASRYPFLEILPRAEQEHGHAASIRRLWAASNTDVLFHTEDDWEFTTDFSLAGLWAALGQFDQCIFWRHDPDFDWRFNPCHRRLTGDYQSLVEAAGYATEPKSDQGWWWPGFSLNPSLLRLDRARALAGAIADDQRFEFKLALTLHQCGFRTRLLSMPGLRHVGHVPASVLAGAWRDHDNESLVAGLVATCRSEPAQSLEIASRIDWSQLAARRRLDALHALVTAQWAADRSGAAATLVRIWREFHASGWLDEPDLRELPAHFGLTWVDCGNLPVAANMPDPTRPRLPDDAPIRD